jgi:multidrug efflux system membrane fusion protein
MLTKPDIAEPARNSGADAASPGNETARPARRRAWGRWVFAIALLALAGAAYKYWPAARQNGPGQFRAGDLRVPVLAATPRVGDVPVYLEGVGVARALNTVTVKAQVEGRLSAIHFKEGADVVQGRLLAEIDPAIFKAQFDQATAKKAQDEALLANARIDLERYRKLAASNAGSKQQADTQAAQVAQLEAQVRADQAAIDNAAATLGYTRIVAPISGRTGLRLVDVGNIVRASDLTGLVVITQIRPIAVQFSLPQQQLPKVNAAFAMGPVPVAVFGADGASILETGMLTGIDNQVDQTTGTVKLKAEFPNATLALWPGQFVNVRIQVDTLASALVVPTSAVQRGPAGAFAYVIGADNTVSARAISVAQQNDTEAVIGSGLAASDRVVTTGFNSLSEGAKVMIGTADGVPTPDLAPKARPEGSRQQGKGPPGPGGRPRH